MLAKWLRARPYSTHATAGRLNPVSVPLISSSLQSQLFPPPTSSYYPPPPSKEATELSVSHLISHSLLPDPSAPVKPPTPLPAPTSFTLPPLQGPTITHHFHSLGAFSGEPYLHLAKSYAALPPPPPQPSLDCWQLLPGWTYYAPDGSYESISFPSEEDEPALVFDVETLKHHAGDFPIMATAIGRKGWYAWCSPWLTKDDESPAHLIPLGPEPRASTSTCSSLLEDEATTPLRILIGHNVLFDRARCSTEYSLRRPATRWLDTLSLHVAVSGLTNPQRPAWMKHRKELSAAASEGNGDEGLLPPSKKSTKKVEETPKSWKDVGSLNSLVEVARLHCDIAIDKSTRDLLIDPTTTPDFIRENFQQFLAYCATDVATTHSVFLALLPKFLSRCPHPASFAGVLLMSQPVLPVDHHWPAYLEKAERTYQTRLDAVNESLVKLAEDAKLLMDVRDENGDFVWEKDVWLRQLDWSPKKARRLHGVVPAKKRVDNVDYAVVVDQKEVEEVLTERTTSTPAWASRFEVLGEPQRWDFKKREETLLLRPEWKGFPVLYSEEHGWIFAVQSKTKSGKNLTKKKHIPDAKEVEVSLNEEKDGRLVAAIEEALGPLDHYTLYTIPSHSKSKVRTLLMKGNMPKARAGTLGGGISEELMKDAWLEDGEVIGEAIRRSYEAAVEGGAEKAKKDIWLAQLDWRSSSKVVTKVKKEVVRTTTTSSRVSEDRDMIWPKWYWDLDTPGLGLDVTIRKRTTPLLLKLQWRGFPILHSKLHGWVYRVPTHAEFDTLREADANLDAVNLCSVDDAQLLQDGNAVFIRLPHPDGEDHRVGSPLSKPFLSSFEDGLLTSVYPAASDALALNASCSYWASCRERIMGQMVVWESDAKHPPPQSSTSSTSADAQPSNTTGMILPQVVPMGTVTRRAVEKTWLTASNAKKNRVGSELKSNVRAPKGYAIVGADVDSEELWICSVMGDAQFGIHGATAVGWMTLEGTKNAGTDLHSKSANILGISRDQAKVFNYSRIYGAGVKHATQLLLKSNPTLAKEQAEKLAKNLYKSTKGSKTRKMQSGEFAFGKPFWHGGTESFVFNKLEEIANAEVPKTPAFGCGLTSALTRKYLPADGKDKAGAGFMPSRINWVVQSSGVDYLHALLVAMEYLTREYQIDARYMISVHDEVRYLVKKEDKYRAAMALQIANVWTRTLFAYRLQIGDLPQSCAFFSAVDIDYCFRKEVNMTCVTPSNPDALPFGESLDISACLAATSGGSLFPDGRPMPELPPQPTTLNLSEEEVKGNAHRGDKVNVDFLRAQTYVDAEDVIRTWRHRSGRRVVKRKARTTTPLSVFSDSTIHDHSDSALYSFMEDIRAAMNNNVPLPLSQKPAHIPPSTRFDELEPDIPDEIDDEWYSDSKASTTRAKMSAY